MSRSESKWGAVLRRQCPCEETLAFAGLSWQSSLSLEGGYVRLGLFQAAQSQS